MDGASRVNEATYSQYPIVVCILLSFAQFERELTCERIRDKIAASKRKGMWMGGLPSLGCDVNDRRLVVNEAEAKTGRYIFISSMPQSPGSCGETRAGGKSVNKGQHET
jgi:DNA invertase Pin-like site-specific DNA recombinase